MSVGPNLHVAISLLNKGQINDMHSSREFFAFLGLVLYWSGHNLVTIKCTHMVVWWPLFKSDLPSTALSWRDSHHVIGRIVKECYLVVTLGW